MIVYYSNRNMKGISKMAEFSYYGNTINIFTDASVVQKGSEYYTCGAAIAILGGNTDCPLKYSSRIFKATNNYGEIDAILLGVLLALKLRNTFPHTRINLFSDSQISIYGLKEWLFMWARRMKDGYFYTSEGKPVANQEVFKKIIHLINYYDLDINFYHIRGHVERVGYNKAMKGFRASNGFQISLDVIRSICKMNTLVDNYSRNTLKEANLANYEALPTFYSYGFPEENRREYMRQFRRHINLRGE